MNVCSRWVVGFALALIGVAAQAQVSSSYRGDFDGDGKSDILLRSSGGAVGIWLMNGGVVKAGTGVATIGADWTISGVGDFNGDGKSDVLLRNNISGAVAIWLMNGGTVTSSVGVGAVGFDWSIAGVGDFDGDGKSDILWRNTDGSVAIWAMNGGLIKAGFGVQTIAPSWLLIGLGDFDGDGKSDILLRNNISGAVAIWLMNGGTLKSNIGVATVGLDWTLTGVGDFDGDGKSDVLLRNSSGGIAMWTMSGGTVTASLGVTTLGSDWSISGLADFDGDGKSDILLRNTSGAVGIWTMNGNAIKAGFGISTLNDEWQFARSASTVLAGRAWTAGQQLETDDNVVYTPQIGIDDQGRATVIFLKSNGTRDVLYATRGTAGAAGAPPTWTTPVAIDVLGGVPVSGYANISRNYGLAVSPSGNVAAWWLNRAPCSAATYNVSGTCTYVYSARYVIATNTWEAPTLVGDSPVTASNDVDIKINDRGDVALLLPGWIRSGTSSYTQVIGVATRAAAAGAFTRNTFGTALGTVSDGNSGLRMDAQGNLLLAGQANQNATTDVVAYRGTIAAGFGPQQILDTFGAVAAYDGVAVGLNGQQVVLWHQSNGTSTDYFGATSATPTGTFAVQDLGLRQNFSTIISAVTDNGTAILYDLNLGYRIRWAAGTWSARETLPTNLGWGSSFYTAGCSLARSGDLLCVNPTGNGPATSGSWSTYDAAQNAAVSAYATTSPGSGYVLGVNTTNKSMGYYGPALSVNGTAVLAMMGQYDVLPSPSLPNGDGRAVTNLWGSFFR